MPVSFYDDTSIIENDTYFINNNDQNISIKPDLWLTFNSNQITSNKGINTT